MVEQFSKKAWPIFPKIVSDKSHSAEKPKESSMLIKRFVFTGNRGGRQ